MAKAEMIEKDRVVIVGNLEAYPISDLAFSADGHRSAGLIGLENGGTCRS